MNDARRNLEAARMRTRIQAMMDQQDNRKFDVVDMRRERNDRAGSQVRSIAGTNVFATFGVNTGGPYPVGA